MRSPLRYCMVLQNMATAYLDEEVLRDLIQIPGLRLALMPHTKGSKRSCSSDRVLLQSPSDRREPPGCVLPGTL